MIITLATWLIMAFVFFITGFAIQSLFSRITKYREKDFFNIMWMGIAAVAFYAQTWSLFAPVSQTAFLVLVGLDVVICLVFRRKYADYVQNTVKEKPFKGICVLGFVVLVAVGLLFTVQVPSHYDTYLYHAQNIRWIEEYGIIKGLGHLHYRLAFNSSFMCLQALFSFAWLLDRSLHTLNGFLWVFMMAYALGTLKVFGSGTSAKSDAEKESHLFLSDLMKALMVFYLCEKMGLEYMSSPHTDMITLILVVYIITRWVELAEEKTKEYVPYAMLCILGCFSVSLKLFAVPILVLVLKPACMLIHEKKGKMIAFFLGSGLLIVLPFLARNVILSGYLAYPYPSIDVFDVEWKIPAFQAEYVNHESAAWGRGLNDVNRYGDPMAVWLPEYLEKQETVISSFVVLNLVLLPASLLMVVYDLYRKRYDESLLLLCGSILFAVWLMTSPLPRYGLVYLFIVPLQYLYMVWEKISFLKKKGTVGKAMFALFLFCMAAMTLRQMRDTDVEEYSYMPADYMYDYFETETVDWNGMVFHVPVEGDQGNYKDFPQILSDVRLEVIEPMGEGIEDGFKMKEEYKNVKMSPSGYLLE